MKVLLVEPVQHTMMPFSLLKLSTMKKQQGCEVKFQYGTQYLSDYEPDEIYITSLFTWEYRETLATILGLMRKNPDARVFFGGICASLMKDRFLKDIKNKKNFSLHAGVDYVIDAYAPDYALFPDTDYSMSYITRGCVNRCPYCMVHKLEPEFVYNDLWQKDIDLNRDKIIFMDNNFLALSDEKIKHVCDILASYGKTIDFNQGLEARRFTKTKAEAMSQLRIHPLRFSYDREPDKEHIINAVYTAFAYGLNDITLYMLWNYMETPEQLYNRLRTIAELSSRVTIFLMKYQPLDIRIKGTYTGMNWKPEQVKMFRKIASDNFGNGCVRFDDTDVFENVFGRSPEEFLSKLAPADESRCERKLTEIFR